MALGKIEEKRAPVKQEAVAPVTIEARVAKLESYVGEPVTNIADVSAALSARIAKLEALNQADKHAEDQETK